MFNRFRHTVIRHKFDIKIFVGATSAIFFYQQFIGQLTLCIGPSMEPTFDQHGETAYVQKLPYILGKKFEKGNVVVAVCPTDPKKRICKRVAAVENEVIIEEQGPGAYVMIRVPPGHYYLRGDNPNNSTGAVQ